MNPSTSHLKDSELIEIVLDKQNPGEFGALMLRYCEKVYFTCLTFIPDSREAWSLTLAVFLEVYRLLPEFDRTQPFSIWLSRLTYNYCVENYRTQIISLEYMEKLGQVEEDPEVEAKKQLIHTLTKTYIRNLPQYKEELFRRIQERKPFLYAVD